MIDTDKYEGLNEVIDKIINSDEIGVDDLLADSIAIKDGINELLAEVKRLQKLEAAVVGSWMQSCNRGSPWHKQLRYPCVDLGYLTLDGFYFELSEEYEEMAKQWLREKYGVEEE